MCHGCNSCPDRFERRASNSPKRRPTAHFERRAFHCANGGQVFSLSAAPAFSREWWPAGALEKIHGPHGEHACDTNCEFVREPRVDHFGNLPGAYVPFDKGGSDRVNYWSVRPCAHTQRSSGRWEVWCWDWRLLCVALRGVAGHCSRTAPCSCVRNIEG